MSIREALSHVSELLHTAKMLVMLARKLARVVFALLKGQSEYQPKVS